MFFFTSPGGMRAFTQTLRYNLRNKLILYHLTRQYFFITWLKKNFWSREKTSKEQLVILNNFLEFLFLTLHVSLNHRKEKKTMVCTIEVNAWLHLRGQNWWQSYMCLGQRLHLHPPTIHGAVFEIQEQHSLYTDIWCLLRFKNVFYPPK